MSEPVEADAGRWGLLQDQVTGQAWLVSQSMHSPFRTLAGENISARFVVPTVAASVDLVVHLGIDAAGVRRVDEIVSVPGRVENDTIETEPLFVRGDGLRRLSGMPPRPERFERAGIDVHAVLREA